MKLEVENSPFNKEQVELLNRLLPTLDERQLVWLSGYITGAQTQTSESVPNTSTAPGRKVTLLYGSHTGNCQSLAEDFENRLKEKGFAAQCLDMDEYKPKKLKEEEDLLLLTSTHGDGDPPDNALSFYEFLYSKRAPKLDGLRFAVLSLGDSSYEFFCQTGKDFDKKLEDLGAQRLHPRVDCDLDYEEDAEKWWSGVLAQLGDGQQKGGSSSEQEPSVEKVPVYSKKHPFRAEVLENINLNGRGSNKETRHVEIDLEGSNLDYEPGDSLGIYPENDERLVDELIEYMEWDPEYVLADHPDGKKCTVRESLRTDFEITALTGPLMKSLALHTSDRELEKIVDSKENLQLYMYGKDLLDVVRDFGPWEVGVDEFVGMLRKIPPRLYSIASSSKANPDEVHLTIATVRYDSNNRKRTGVCSGQCAERTEAGDYLPVYVQKNKNFNLPENPETPIIMIGAGTGAAPYRAFLEEREEEGHSGQSWLFFGDQHFVTDFLYQVEWQRWLKEGVLTKMDVAFSRDASEKIYVQHRLYEKRKEIYQWLEEGAHIYVCGDEKQMAKDVHATIQQILLEEGGTTEEEAEDYLKEMRKNKRYQRDVY